MLIKRVKILITCKTYPSLTVNDDEVVCTGGITEEGKWYRIHPIPFRKLDYDKRYKKYQWIEIDLIKHDSDFRPESYKPVNYSNIILGEYLDTKKYGWEFRKNIILKKVYTSFKQLISEAHNKKICTSLAIFKPDKILDLIVEKEDRTNWDPKKVKAFKERASQHDLFKDAEVPFEVVPKIPYKFIYCFTDEDNKKHQLKITDWEVGQLYYNCLKKNHGDDKRAINDVRKKIFDHLMKKCDLYFYLGTTRVFHFMSRNPFIITGIFYPPKENQISLFN